VPPPRLRRVPEWDDASRVPRRALVIGVGSSGGTVMEDRKAWVAYYRGWVGDSDMTKGQRERARERFFRRMYELYPDVDWENEFLWAAWRAWYSRQ
jgi:hypothetical protein